jgi:hypothetical protein
VDQNGTVYCEQVTTKQDGYCEQSLYAWSIPYWNQYTVNHPVTISVPFIIVGTILVGNWNLIAALRLLNIETVNVNLLAACVCQKFLRVHP